MKSNITITNSSQQTALISIEGVIGVSEAVQRDQRDGAVSTYESFKQQLELISQIDSPQIVVDIRSTGGSVNDALLIYDAIVSTGAVVTTRCYGYVASAATIIAQAASEGLRQISANALYLIHNSVSEAEGNAQKLSQTAELLDKTDQTIAAIYAARSGGEVEEFVALMGENSGSGRWLTPTEAKEYGLVDDIIENSTMVESVVNYSREKIAVLWDKLVSALGVGHGHKDVPEQALDAKVAEADESKNEQVTQMDCSESGHEAEAEAEAEIEVISREEYDKLQQENDLDEGADLSAHADDELDLEIDNVSLQASKVVDQAMGVAKFETAEAIEARAAALASKTMEIDDPAMDEAKPMGNTKAYYEDVKNF